VILTKEEKQSTENGAAKYFMGGGDDVWACNCKKTGKKGDDWGNLMDRIQHEHSAWLEEACMTEGGPILK
jgi:hypothetical protein